MKLKAKYWFLIAVIAISGLWLGRWIMADEEDQLERFAFVFRAKADGHLVDFESSIECTPRSVSDGSAFGTSTIYRVKPRSFAKELPNGKVLYVAVPDICGLLRDDGTDTSVSKQWPLPVVPLIYIADTKKDPSLVHLFASPSGPAKSAGIKIAESWVKPIGAADHRNSTEGANFDPFLPKAGSKDLWVGIAFLPSYAVTEIKPEWVTEVIRDSTCQLFALSEAGSQALREVDPYTEYLGAYWPPLSRNVAPSMVSTGVNATREQLQNSKRALDLVRAVRLENGWAELRPAEKGQVVLYQANEFLALGGRSIHKYRIITDQIPPQAYEIPFSTPPARIQTFLKCDDSDSLYFPTLLHFSFS